MNAFAEVKKYKSVGDKMCLGYLATSKPEKKCSNHLLCRQWRIKWGADWVTARGPQHLGTPKP